MQKITGRVAVVTGAASGIGRATAKHMIERGCAVAAADIDAGGLATLADEVGRSGGTLSTHLVDVANRSQMAVLPERVLAEHGHVHILVNNAGVALGQTVEDLSWEDFDWLVGINFWGVVHGCKFFLPYLQREEEAHIANISSMFGFAGLPTQGPYCATKAAVRSFSETPRSESRAFTRAGSRRTSCAMPASRTRRLGTASSRASSDAVPSRRSWPAASYAPSRSTGYGS